jgi:hypothetical protein
MGIEDPTKRIAEKVEMTSSTIERIPPMPGGTLIIMQRHGNYDRETGHLTEEGKADSLERSRKIIEDIITQIPDEERSKVKLLVVASPTIKNEGQRSVETAQTVIESAHAVFQEFNIPQENILAETPRLVEDIEEPRIFKDDTGFHQFLVDKYGQGTKEFWQAYEEEKHKEEREKMGAEGPIEMSDRFAHFNNVLGRYARQFHEKHKDQPVRLIIWNVSHYDTITTYFKNHVSGIPQEEYVPVGYDGGMSLLIDSHNEASVTLKGVNYPVKLSSRGTSLERKKDKDISPE